MSTVIYIDDNDDYVYFFDTFEVGFGSDGVNYILCDTGYFEFSGLQDFKIDNGNIYIVNEDNEMFYITNEDFELLKELIQKYGKKTTSIQVTS